MKSIFFKAIPDEEDAAETQQRPEGHKNCYVSLAEILKSQRPITFYYIKPGEQAFEKQVPEPSPVRNSQTSTPSYILLRNATKEQAFERSHFSTPRPRSSSSPKICGFT
jgi:hypothetical protein